MDLGLAGRVYLVGGGSRGLGFAVARELVAEGARVLVTGRDPGRLAEAARALGERAHPAAADNADASGPARLVDAALERWGRLDGALVNGGGPAVGDLAQLDDEAWREAFELVFLGAVRIARVLGAALPDGGALAFVLSTSARVPIPGLDLSNGLRPGLAGLTKSLAASLGGRGVRVNALLPGRISTERTRVVDAGTAAGDPTAGIPLGRAGEPAEFGRVAAFVLSPAASYLHGAAIPVDGGSTPSW